MQDPVPWLDALGLPPAGGRVLLLVAHPDDETIGAGGLLLAAATSPELRVGLLYLTDGAPPGGPDTARADGDDRLAYGARRRAELARALAIAEVDAPVAALGCIDQRAADDLPELTDRVRRHILADAPDVVLTHAYEGGHPDHDAACFAAHAAAALIGGSAAPRVVEMPFYHAAEGRPVYQRFLPAAVPVRESTVVRERTVVLPQRLQVLKRRMLGAFASQAATLAPFGVRHEHYRQGAWPAFTRPAHRGTPLYELWDLGMTARRWCAQADAALAALGLGERRWV